MNKLLEKDLYRYEGERSRSLLIRYKYIFLVPGFTYTYFLRNAQFAKFSAYRLFCKILLRITSYITNIQIPIGTTIGEGLYIGHWGTIIVNPDARIGKNFNIYPGCLIGYSLGKNEGVPIIGNNVSMRCNSIIVGGVKIGDNVLIAPGAFVNFDVPNNCIVIGNPGRIIERQSSPTEKYIVYPV